MIEPVSSPDAERERRSAAGRNSPQLWHRLLAGGLLLLLALVVIPPFININRFRRSIVHSISDGLGRPVEASAVELEVLPRPGFVLHNLTVGEDPAYGAEPVMTAQTVTAGLRASTLWHARVEIATLHFDAPSVNLVRDTQGHWNFEPLLRNSPALRSRRSSASSRPLPFPYVEATGARVNFKLGPEKLPFSLERADLAVWKESSHEWRLRIKARPVRTDLTVMDAGQIRGEGTLMTGGVLMSSPVRANIEWRRVQLSEISRLVHGEDDGWRGSVDWTAKAQGTLADLWLESDLAVEEFRRAEFVPTGEMDFSAHCKARYVRSNPALDSLQCNAPVGSGQLLLRGSGSSQVNGVELSVGNSSGPVWRMSRNLRQGVSSYSESTEPASCQIELQKVPAQFFLDLLGHIHPGVDGAATASGEVNGQVGCDWQGLETLTAYTGAIRSTDLRLHLAHLDHSLTASPFLLEHSLAENHLSMAASSAAGWKLSPLHVSLGGATPATITGTFTSAGSTLQITGPASLAELAKLAQSLKIPAISGEVQSIRGESQLALSLESIWLPRAGTLAANGGQDVQAAESVQTPQPAEFAASRWTGSVQVRDATMKIASLPDRLQLASARVNVTPDGVEWTDIDGTFAHIPFNGSIWWRTPCATSKMPCARTFSLHTRDLNVDHLQTALSKGQSTSDLLNLINPWTGGAPQLPEISGTLNVDELSAGPISLKNAVLRLRMKGHGADLMAISGKVFGGTISGEQDSPADAAESGEGSMQWGDGAPAYTLHVSLEHIQPDSVAAIWHEHWGGGVADVQIDFKSQGWSAAELAQNASGKFGINWMNGGRAAATGITENFQRWDAKGTFRNRTLVLNRSRMVPLAAAQRGHSLSTGTQSVTGTGTFARVLNLRLAPSGISIAGTLSVPVVKLPGT